VSGEEICKNCKIRYKCFSTAPNDNLEIKEIQEREGSADSTSITLRKALKSASLNEGIAYTRKRMNISRKISHEAVDGRMYSQF
jgi:uncharacterized protein (UPF0179 family)